jgi:hypothetical protein
MSFSQHWGGVLVEHRGYGEAFCFLIIIGRSGPDL